MGVRLARKLTEAERHVDVEGIDAALNLAKDRLEAGIEAEKRRAIRRTERGLKARLDVTEAMLTVLRTLFREGRRHASAEMRSLGLERRFATDPLDAPETAAIERARRQLSPLLGSIAARVDAENAVIADIGGYGAAAVRRRLLRLPGARDAASRVISGAFTDGRASTFEGNEDLFSGWQATAILDAGTCPPCAAGDRTVFATLAEAYVLYPSFGPRIDCYGDGRCRCTLLPLV